MLMLVSIASHGVAAITSEPTILDCAETGPRSGIGHAFVGKVHNDDYKFTALIPSGLTGWTGTAESAPFHGFKFYLDNSKESCVIFELSIRVDERDTEKRPSDAKSVDLRGAKAWQIGRSGRVRGTEYYNLKTVFSVLSSQQVTEGSIVLITPFPASRRSINIYRIFLDNLRFQN